MRNVTKSAIRIGVVLSWVVWMAMAIGFYFEKRSLRRLVDEMSAVARRTNASSEVTLERKVILSYLELPGGAGVEACKLHIQHALNRESDPRPKDLDEMLALYRAKEPAGRSNYFGDLVGMLSGQVDSSKVSKTVLLQYLGSPDETEDSAQGQLLKYRFKSDGRDAEAVALVTNDMVVCLAWSD